VPLDPFRLLEAKLVAVFVIMVVITILYALIRVMVR
jgi:hypothetical protein